jgi:hypothetical protein
MSRFLFAYLFVSCPCHNCGNYVVTSPKYRGSFIELRAAATADVEHLRWRDVVDRTADQIPRIRMQIGECCKFFTVGRLTDRENCMLR